MSHWKNSHWIFFLLLFFVSGCEKPEATHVAPIDQGKLVKTIKLQGMQQISERSYPGIIAANQKVDLAFQVSGQLLELPVEKGKSVKTGQLLAKLDIREFASNVKEAKAAYINAKAQFERAQSLITKGHISKADYDKLLSEYEKSQAKLSIAEKSLSDATLTAPFAGIVANTFVNNYQNIQSKQKILSLQNLTHLDIVTHLPEQDLVFARQNAGKKDGVSYYVILNAVPDRKFQTTLKEIAAEADKATNTYEVTLTMPMPEDLTILPGMAATFVLILPSSQRQKSLNIPVEAVGIDAKGQRYVWVVDEKNSVVHKKIVTVGMFTNNGIQILSGLDGDERIVSAGTTLLTEGMKVRLWQNKTSAQP